MLLNELNLRALAVNAQSVLPIEKIFNVEGRELKFKITAFQNRFGSGKKSVISGSVSLNDENHTSIALENSDIEEIRRKVSKLCGLKTSSARKSRAPKEPVVKTEVEKLRDSLAVARRLPKEWVTINTAGVWKAYQKAKQLDATPNKLLKLSALDAEKQLKVYELLKKEGLL